MAKLLVFLLPFCTVVYVYGYLGGFEFGNFSRAISSILRHGSRPYLGKSRNNYKSTTVKQNLITLANFISLVEQKIQNGPPSLHIMNID